MSRALLNSDDFTVSNPLFSKGLLRCRLHDCSRNPIWNEFSDVCSFLADYFAGYQMTDVMEHCAGAPCPPPTFRYQYSFGVPNFSYTSGVNSRHVSFTKSLDRSDLVKYHGLFPQDERFLRTKEGNISSSNGIGRCLLFKLAMELKEGLKSIKERKSLKGLFGPYC